jgi:monofunctional biosynthetic peptidoglycan transglycosylase
MPEYRAVSKARGSKKKPSAAKRGRQRASHGTLWPWAGRSAGWSGGGLGGWLRRIAIALLVIFVVAPLALILLYRFVPPPVTPLMLIRLVEGHGLSRDWVSWEEISPQLRQAVVASEDNLFCEHSGFDWQSLQAAAEAYASGEQAGGGSTISQQTAKNLFLWPQRSVVRKAMEVPLTAAIEVIWPKRRILEVYLNIVELGPGIYGAEAAARHYFDRAAGDLTAAQAARLAAVLPNPLEWSPQPAGSYVQQRGRVIQARIRQLGPLLDCVRD